MSRVIVRKLNTRGEVVTSYQAELVERLADGVRLEARWERPALDLGYVTFATGDRFVEWFFGDRWYNIFEIHAADGALKGWYCNVAAPAAIAEGVITCRDLLLDLWVAPDGGMRVLDEDEFAADETLAAATRAAATRAAALAALDALRRMVAQRLPPFDALPGSHPPTPSPTRIGEAEEGDL